MKTIRIFISSPGDVAIERDKARKVVEGLQKRYTGRLRLETVLWEDLPLGAVNSFQGGIDVMLKGEQAIDIAVFILWSRLGSPLGATIRKPDGSAYRSGTEREFDLMLAARTHSADGRPEILVYVRQDDRLFKAALQDAPTDQIEELLRQHKQAEQFIREQFHDAETGCNVRAYHTFPEPNSFAERLKTHLRSLLDTITLDGGLGFGTWEGSPYRGLEVFRSEHAPIFFGRDEEVCEALERLRAQAVTGCAFLLLVGASGSGKSSLARAGILPALETDNIDETIAEWRTAALTPGECTDGLCRGLARVLLERIPELRTDDESLTDLEEALRDGKGKALTLLLRRACAGTGVRDSFHLVLLIDQLEELFTHPAINESEAAAFLAALQALAVSNCVWVLATVRSDFYDRCQRFPVIMAMKGDRGQMDLLPPEPSDIHRIITGPAILAGLAFEKNASGESLDQRILNDAVSHPEALPLIEFALAQIYETRSAEGLLTFAAYDKLGGVEGSIGRHAESVYASLGPVARQAFVKVLPLLSEASPPHAGEFVRRRCPEQECAMIDGATEAIQSMLRARLLVRDTSTDGRIVIFVSHETLCTRWERARQVLRDAMTQIEMRGYLCGEADRWVRFGKPRHLLIPHERLKYAGELIRRSSFPLPFSLLDYVRDSEHRAGRRGLWTAMGILLAFQFVVEAAGLGVISKLLRSLPPDAKISSIPIFAANKLVLSWLLFAIPAFIVASKSIPVLRCAHSYRTAVLCSIHTVSCLFISGRIFAVFLFQSNMSSSLRELLLRIGIPSLVLLAGSSTLGVRSAIEYCRWPKWFRQHSQRDRVRAWFSLACTVGYLLLSSIPWIFVSSSVIEKAQPASDEYRVLIADGGIPEDAAWTPLARECNRTALDPVEAVALLLQNGADVEVSDRRGLRPLMIAAVHGHIETGRLLLEHGAKVDARGYRGHTALILAALKGRMAFCRLLLEQGADSGKQDDSGQTASCYAAFIGRRDLVALLWDQPVFDLSSIRQAIANGRRPAKDLVHALCCAASSAEYNKDLLMARSLYEEALQVIQPDALAFRPFILQRAAIYSCIKRQYSHAAERQAELVSLLQTHDPVDVNQRKKLSEALSDLSWYRQLAWQSLDSLAAGEKAIALLGNDNACPVRLKLAHAYLFNEQFEKAKTIYAKYIGTAFEDGRKWNDELRNDFRTLREAGHDHPDMKKIEALFEERTPAKKD